jgi:hypothetical protein
MNKLIAAFGLLFFLLAGFASAFETAQAVTATPITAVPFVISAPGNYFLVSDLTSSAPGVAITIDANEVVLDLNGRSLKAAGAAASPNIGIAIAVLNHEDVIIQNGDIDKFGYIGVLLDATDGLKEHNQKNRVEHVNFNGDEVGVLSVSGSIDVVENCDFDQGSVGIYDIAGVGDRFQKDNFQAQHGVEALNEGIGVVSATGAAGGTLTEDCLFAAEGTLGIFDGGPNDKVRFDTFIHNAANRSGGIEELAGDL